MYGLSVRTNVQERKKVQSLREIYICFVSKVRLNFIPFLKIKVLSSVLSSQKFPKMIGLTHLLTKALFISTVNYLSISFTVLAMKYTVV